MKLPKILHITKKYPDALGGDAIVVANLEKQHQAKGGETAVLTSNCANIVADEHHHKFGLSDTAANLDKITPRRLLSLGALFFKSFGVIRKEKPDVIHTHSVDMAVAVRPAARLFKVPVVHTFHVVTFHDERQPAIRRKTELKLLRAAKPTVVTAPDEADVAHLQAAGVNNAQLLPNGIDLGFWSKRRAHRPKGKRPFTFITVGRLEEQKGYEYLVRAAAELKKQTKKPFKVVIVGEGTQGEALRALARKLKVAKVVEFTGRKTPEEVRDLYRAADVMVMPSLWEAAALTVYEAWAMELPLVTTRAGIFQDEPSSSKRAALVDMRDADSLASAMAQVLKGAKLRRELGAAGRAVAEEHSWEKIHAKAQHVYKQALAGKPKLAAAKAKPATVNISTKPTVDPVAGPAAPRRVNKRAAIAVLSLASMLSLALAPLTSSILNAFVALPLAVAVPGLLLVARFWPEQGRKAPLAATLSATLGLLLIAAESLALNWLLPLVHIGAPLQAKYLVPLHVLVTALLLGLYLKQPATKEDQHIELRISWRRTARFVVPLLLPLLAAAGAMRQNNGASNTLTILAYLGMAGLAAWFAIKPKAWNAAWLLWNIALGLLLSTSFRSWFVSGFDISQEFQVFTTTLQAHHWNLHALPGNAYNACLSLTTLPTALQQFSHLSPEFIFKFFYQVLFALTAVLTYLISRRWLTRRLAFMAALLFAAQTQFIGTMPAIARQEIGLIFFGLLMYFIFDAGKLGRARKALLVLLSLGMVLTHYSTTYLTIMIFTLAAALLVAARLAHKRWPKFPQLKTTVVNASTLAKLAVLLVLLSGIWYAQINASSSNLTTTLRQAAHLRLPHSLQPDTTTSKFQTLLGGNPNENNPENVAKYAGSITTYAPIHAADAPSLAVHNRALAALAGVARLLLSVTIKFVLPLSPVILLAYKKTRRAAADVSFVALGAMSVFALTIIIPALSVAYNLQRVYQQLLIIMAATSLWALWQLLPVGQRLKTALVAAFTLAFLVCSPGAGLVNQLSGGMGPRLTMNSVGEEYDKYYVQPTDVLAAQWLAANCKGQRISADRYATLRLTAYASVPYDSIHNDILSTKQQGCLYLDGANVHNGVFYASYKKQAVRYTTPNSSFKDYNLLYTNGSAAVYSY